MTPMQLKLVINSGTASTICHVIIRKVLLKTFRNTIANRSTRIYLELVYHLFSYVHINLQYMNTHNVDHAQTSFRHHMVNILASKLAC